MKCKKSQALGVSLGKASGQLRRDVMFSLIVRLKENFCFHCGVEIEKSTDMSIEHKDPWFGTADPLKSFLDIGNIAFSHRACNYGAARRPNQKYASPEDRDRAQQYRRRQGDGWKRTVAKRREKRRLARLENSTGVVQ